MGDTNREDTNVMKHSIVTLGGAALLTLAAGLRSGAETGTYPYSDAQLFERGEMRTYAGEHLEAISFPVGGVGTGAIHIDGNGVRHGWMIFPRYWLRTTVSDKPEPTQSHYVQANKRIPMDKPKKLPWYLSYVPDSFFAVRAEDADGKTTVRTLQTLKEGAFKAVQRLSLRGAYPFAWYNFEDDALPVNVSLRTWNPLIPCDLKNSAIPCAIYNLTAENPGDTPIDVTFLATQQNPIGFTGRERSVDGVKGGGNGFNVNRIRKGAGGVMLHMTSSRNEDSTGYGDMALVTPADKTSATAAWYTSEELHADFAEDDLLEAVAEAGPTAEGKTVNGALARTMTLKPGGKQTVTFVLAWHFPNARHAGGAWRGTGNQYTNWWADATAVAEYVMNRYADLERRTEAYQTALYESNLPCWMLQRISSQVTPIRTRTVFWAEDGYFGAWEGMNAGTGSCPGNCSHVWHYAQACARLFPELGKIMREQEYRYPLPDGGLRYRQITQPLEEGKTYGYPAADGQLGTILGTYREYTTSRDHTWMKAIWPSVRDALQFIIDTWDDDHDGVLDGIQHTTLDCKVAGSTPWLGSMYLAALRAGEDMARVVGDTERAKAYRKMHVSGSCIQDETLFNGEYYVQHVDGHPEDLFDYYTEKGFRHKTHPAFIGGQNWFNGCEIDQMLGQWWANQLDLGWLYPREHVRSAMRSVFKYNYVPKMKAYKARPVPWVDPEDGGMVVLTFPKGVDKRLKGKKRLGYYTCTLTGFEYAAAATMIQSGLLREGFTVVRTISDRYDGRLRVGLHKTTWGYSGNPFGDDESGKWYARAQSAWSLLLAAQGYMYDGPEGVIGFDPAWKPKDHRSFFTVADGFGVFSQKRRSRKQVCSIDMRDGQVAVRKLALHVPEKTAVETASITLGDRDLPVRITQAGRRVTLAFHKPVTVSGEHVLNVVLPIETTLGASRTFSLADIQNR